MNTKMKIILGVGVAALLAVAGFSFTKNTSSDTPVAAAISASENSQFLSYTDAVTKAKAEGKFILVDVYTDWCVWCKRMDKDVYTDPAVKAEMDKYFTSVKLNAEAPKEHPFRGAATSEEGIAKNLQVTGYPTTVFMTADEQVIQVVPGYIKAPEFALALRYIGTKSYERQNFEDWKKTQI